jgi:hypothetical protein
MKNQPHKSLLQGIRDLHIKILQSNNLPEVGKYLQEILDKVIPASPEVSEKIQSGLSKDLHTSRIIQVLKADIKSILDGTYNRLEIAKFKATLDIAWLKGLFTDQSIQKGTELSGQDAGSL